MKIVRGKPKLILSFVLLVIPVLTACGGNQTAITPTPVPISTSTVTVALPTILSVEADRDEGPRYEPVELTLDIDAEYSNPYNVRNVALEAVFTSPDGRAMIVPGFWDGEASWKIRFTPSEEGLWT